MIKRFFGGYKGKTLILLAIMFSYYFIPVIKININQAFFILNNVDIYFATGYIQGFNNLAPVASFLLMAFQSVVIPLPSYTIVAANSELFGLFKGILLSWFSSLAGAALCFCATRYFFRETVAKLASRTVLKRMDLFLGRYGGHVVLITRLLPFVSFDIVSYVAGLTSMRFRHFITATGIGQLPLIIVFSCMGDMLTGNTKTIVYGTSVFIAFCLIVVFIKHMRKEHIKGL